MIWRYSAIDVSSSLRNSRPLSVWSVFTGPGSAWDIQKRKKASPTDTAIFLVDEHSHGEPRKQIYSIKNVGIFSFAAISFQVRTDLFVELSSTRKGNFWFRLLVSVKQTTLAITNFFKETLRLSTQFPSVFEQSRHQKMLMSFNSLVKRFQSIIVNYFKKSNGSHPLFCPIQLLTDSFSGF